MKKYIIPIAIIYLLIGSLIPYVTIRVNRHREDKPELIRVILVIMFYPFVIGKFILDEFIDDNF